LSLFPDSVKTRLMDGHGPCAGRVEVFYRGEWGRVCNTDWDTKDSNVVCAELNCGEVLSFHQAPIFRSGQGRGWRSKVHCSSTETSLRDCPGGTDWDQDYCSHNQEVGVVCGASFKKPQIVVSVQGVVKLNCLTTETLSNVTYLLVKNSKLLDENGNGTFYIGNRNASDSNGNDTCRIVREKEFSSDSSPISITITAPPALSVNSSVSVRGADVTMQCSLSSSYQSPGWFILYRDREEVQEQSVPGGVNSFTFNLTRNTTHGQQGEYSCRYYTQSQTGWVLTEHSAPVTITEHLPVVITSFKKPQIVVSVRGVVKLNCLTTETLSNVTYLLVKNSKPLDENGNGTFYIGNRNASDSNGNYTCRIVREKEFSSDSSPISITITAPPALSVNSSVSVRGADVTMQCSLSSSYQSPGWFILYRDREEVQEQSVPGGVNSFTFNLIRNTTHGQQGEYSCRYYTQSQTGWVLTEHSAPVTITEHLPVVISSCTWVAIGTGSAVGLIILVCVAALCVWKIIQGRKEPNRSSLDLCPQNQPDHIYELEPMPAVKVPDTEVSQQRNEDDISYASLNSDFLRQNRATVNQEREACVYADVIAGH
ncbi:hypothetical protein HHUSO_G35990, partial [Huso huso]